MEPLSICLTTGLSIDWDGVHQTLGGILPIAFWVLRFAMILLGLVVLYRCIWSLFREKQKKEVWGLLTLPNGTSYELGHWENLLGRGKSADIILEFPSVSRTHAAVMRDDKGDWTLFPLQTKNGTFLNGEEVAESVSLETGDVIGLGGLELFFYPAIEDKAGKKRQSVYKRQLSPNRTLTLLTFFQGLMLLQSLLAVRPEYLFHILSAYLVLSGAMWCLYVIYRVFARTAFEVETMAFFLCSLSVGITAAYSPPALLTQLVTMIIGIGAFLALSLALRDIKMAVKLRWPAAIMAGGLLSFNLLLGERIFGAKNWISIGPFSFQPSEFIKIAFVIVGAATLDRLFANRNLIFTTLFAGFCVGCLALMSDFGTALVFFVAFLVIAFLRSGNLGFLGMMGVGAGLGVGIILHFKPYIANRFAAWGHVWDFASTSGFQQTRTLSAISSGGLFGKPPDQLFLKNIFAANTDLVFGVTAETYGLLLALCTVVVIVALALFTVKSAGAARSSFYTIGAATAVSMLLVQTCLNVFGSVDILPLTGVTFPFVSVGGSSMIACWGLLAFIKAADTRRNATFTAKRLKFLTRLDQTEDEEQDDLLAGPLEDEADWEVPR